MNQSLPTLLIFDNPMNTSVFNKILFSLFLTSALTQPLSAQLDYAQEAYIKASNTEDRDSFGLATAASGNTLAISAYDDSDAIGINNDGNNNNAESAGSVHVFIYENGAWSQQAYIKASNTDANDRFGRSIALDGDTLVVSANGESSNAQGIDGDQTNNDAQFSGAVYVFKRTNGVWAQEAYIKASNAEAFDSFGGDVALYGNTLVVGATGEDSDATAVNGDQDNSLTGFSYGAAYVFERTATGWQQQAYLKASNSGRNDLFGRSVAIWGNTIAVSSAEESSNATGINGDQNNDLAEDSGAVYVFKRTNDTWSQQAYIKASNAEADDEFGEEIALYQDTLVVGVVNEDSDGVGINSNQNNNLAEQSGAVYVFNRENDVWSQQAYIKASNAEAGDEFGSSVAIQNNRLIIGASREQSNALGLDGDQNDNSLERSGAAYLMLNTGGTWQQESYIKASNTESFDAFGGQVSLLGTDFIVSATGEFSSATGINGDQSNNTLIASGAVYVYRAEDLIFPDGFD